MEEIKKAFRRCRSEERSALITFVTAGYPSIEDTPKILLGLQAGGTDILELGIPFSEPTADGPTIQQANQHALEQRINIRDCFEMITTARTQGLTIPVLLMGYLNPIVKYGVEGFLSDAARAGVNGFIIADLPFEESLPFRTRCGAVGLSLIPLVAPITSDSRLKRICDSADSFIYVVSKMGTTGASGISEPTLPLFLEKVRQFSHKKPLAIGFGVRTKDDFAYVSKYGDGVVIGSQIINIIRDAGRLNAPSAIEEFCRSMRRKRKNSTMAKISISMEVTLVKNGALSSCQQTVEEFEKIPEYVHQEFRRRRSSVQIPSGATDFPMLASYFGKFGGCYVPEALIECLARIEASWIAAQDDARFWSEFHSYRQRLTKSNILQFASHLTKCTGGARIWLKREDLNTTGNYKIYNVLGQALLAKRLGLAKIVTETGSRGDHGVSAATICAMLEIQCTIFMGEMDAKRQMGNISRMRLLGARVVVVQNSTGSIRDAVNEALRYLVANYADTYYLSSSALGPHPLPTISRTFNSMIGNGIKTLMLKERGKLPDAVVACVGSGANAIGAFSPFIKYPTVKLIGVETQVRETQSSTALADRCMEHSVGILQGSKTHVIQDHNGQILDLHTPSSQLLYAAIGPELAHLKHTKRVETATVTDRQAAEAFMLSSQLEDVIPAIEASYAVHETIRLARTMEPDQDIVVVISGRGDEPPKILEDETITTE